MAAMSISARINGPGGRTKARGASAPALRGPEHRTAPPPAAGSPPPLEQHPLGPLQTTLASRRGAQQAGVESEGRAGPPCRAMSGADTQVCTQVAAEPPMNPESQPPVLANSSDEPPPVPKEVPGNNLMMGPPKEHARRRSRTRRSPAAPQVDSPAKPAALESIKSTPRRNEEAQSTAARRPGRYRPSKAPQTGREPSMPSPNARHHPLAHPLNECRQPKLQTTSSLIFVLLALLLPSCAVIAACFRPSHATGLIVSASPCPERDLRPVSMASAPSFAAPVARAWAAVPTAPQVKPAKTTPAVAAAPAPRVDSAPKWASECCLLYTSPSPRDRQKSRMPSSA